MSFGKTRIRTGVNGECISVHVAGTHSLKFRAFIGGQIGFQVRVCVCVCIMFVCGFIRRAICTGPVEPPDKRMEIAGNIVERF